MMHSDKHTDTETDKERDWFADHGWKCRSERELGCCSSCACPSLNRPCLISRHSGTLALRPHRRTVLMKIMLLKAIVVQQVVSYCQSGIAPPWVSSSSSSFARRLVWRWWVSNAVHSGNSGNALRCQSLLHTRREEVIDRWGNLQCHGSSHLL